MTDAAFYAEIEGGVFGRVLDLLNRMDEAHVYYKLDPTRPESVMVDVAVPGWRWEIEFLADGSLEIERLQSRSGVETNPALIEELFED